MVLGSTGMLGQALVQELSKRKKKVIGLARKNADISIDITDHAQLISAIETIKPDVIINTVAIVNLAYCQNNAKQCYLINAKPSWILSNCCTTNNVKYVYISTDHFFSGDKDRRHSEDADINLCNVYAMTKYMGEEYALLNENALAVRTNIVGFRHNKAAPTFVEWIIQALNSGEAIALFDDYYTSSIDVKTFSKALCDLITNNAKGLINLASRQVVSKKMFIQAFADKIQLPLKNVTSGSVTDIADGIERNESLGLDVTLAETILDYPLPTLADVIDNLAIVYTNKEMER